MEKEEMRFKKKINVFFRPDGTSFLLDGQE